MDPITWFYLIASATAATATILSADAQAKASLERARLAEEELRATELDALDQENQRLMELRFANEQIIANAGGVDAYASPSLTAARQFNFKQAESDVLNIGYNKAMARSATSVKVRILKRNARVAMQSGILQAASTMFNAGANISALKTPTLKIGEGGANTTKGIGWNEVSGFDPNSVNV